MKFKRTFFLIFFVAINLFIQSVIAQSSVWKVSKGDNYFYLGGTIHMLTEEDHPLPDEFLIAYNDANEVIFETNLTEVGTPQYQSKMTQVMTYHDGSTLIDELSPETYTQLDNFLTRRGIAIAHFSTFQPWGVALVLSIMEYQRLGMTGEFGVDSYFNHLALQDNKIISNLETPDEQLMALTSMSFIEPNEAISLSLRDIERLPELIGSMKAMWRSGDLEMLSKHPLVAQMKMETPKMYKALVIDRNNNWMKKLPLLVDNKNIEFVMVGAMHLVGKDGLLHLLKQQGFQIELL